MKELYREETSLPVSINHHHTRVYEHEGSFYMLDKTMDGVPPFYSFYGLHFDPRITHGMPTRINVDNQEYWGDDISWKEAEEKVQAIMITDGGE